MTTLVTKIRDLLKNPAYRQFIKFSFVGVLNTSIHYGIFFVMIRMGFFYVVATTVGTAIAIINSYLWNKFFTFRSKKKSVAEVIRFLLVCGGQYLVNLTVLFLCITHAGIPPEIAGLIAACVSVFIGYFGHKFASFRV